MSDTGVVDQNGDCPERRLRGAERPHHSGAVGDIGLDRDRASARGRDAGNRFPQTLGAPRHQHDRGAVGGQHVGEARAEPAGSARDQRDAAINLEQIGGFHVVHD